MIQLLVSAAVFYLCCDVSAADVVFGTMCAYAVQHFADTVISNLHYDRIFAELNGNGLAFSWDEILVYAIVYVTAYFKVSKKLSHQGRYHARLGQFFSSAVLVLSFAMVFSFAAKIFFFRSPSPLFFICMLFDGLCCFFVLWLQINWKREKRLMEEVEREKYIRTKQKEQYEIAKDSVERINKKCHDLKHMVAQIRALGSSEDIDHELAKMEDAVMFYDYMVRSGNEVIDTVLTEKSLVCEQKGITWTCMADGASLDFMGEEELYTLFVNLIEFAIKSVDEVENARQRIIAVVLKKSKGMALIQVENYCNQASDKNISRRGSPLWQVKYIVEKYGGSMDTAYEDNLSILTALIPIPNTN